MSTSQRVFILTHISQWMRLGHHLMISRSSHKYKHTFEQKERSGLSHTQQQPKQTTILLVSKEKRDRPSYGVNPIMSSMPFSVLLLLHHDLGNQHRQKCEPMATTLCASITPAHPLPLKISFLFSFVQIV